MCHRNEIVECLETLEEHLDSDLQGKWTELYSTCCLVGLWNARLESVSLE